MPKSMFSLSCWEYNSKQIQWFGEYIAYDTSLRVTDVPAGDRKVSVGRLIDIDGSKLSISTYFLHA